ncbi:MAG: 3'-5' exonuclease [bacterium]|nr:3'-5' exonuclease [bacterium]
MNSAIPPYLQGLNPAQQQAATHVNGPLLIIAGAGAGKTSTMAHRMAHLIATTTPGHRILGITFTNKAAGELRARVRSLLAKEGIGDPEDEPLIATFHGLGVLILRQQATVLKRSPRFSILGRDDSISLLKRLMKERGYDPKTLDPRKILGVISKNKSSLTPRVDFGAEAQSSFAKHVAVLWEAYEHALKKSEAYDFDDLVSIPVTLLRDNDQVCDIYRNRWTHVHIDEYQDTSSAQDLFARLLVGPARNICVVGDSDQSIYGWRDADPRNLLYFEKHFSDATLILLEQNYRSTKPIIEAANEVISKNTTRHDKTLFTKRDSEKLIDVYEAGNEYDEAQYVVSRIAETLQGDTPAHEIAVLYRANYQSRAFEEALLREGISYQLIGVRFYERKEVKDILAYLMLALNPEDSISFARTINTPKRGLGPKAQELIALGRIHELTPSSAKKYNEYVALCTGIRDMMQQLSVSELVAHIIEASGLREELVKSDEEERIENLNELVSLASRYNEMEGIDGVVSLLEHASLMADQDEIGESSGGVRLMTVHAAKGLEFKTVFIAGMEQGLFPSDRVREGMDSQIVAEEERRLFYVAITRAKDMLVLSYAGMRTVYGSREPRIASTFLNDIPPHLLHFEQSALRPQSIYQQNTPDLDVIQWDCLGT